MLGEMTRAFRKAGKPDATDLTKAAYANQLPKIGVPIMERSSTKISKAIKDEISVEDLK
jgi:hypothetical protein